jgi:uncharacterized protein (DUF1697 family)
MPRYVAFLRGVGPMNARMPELKACFESAGFDGVKTVLGSGNVVFSSRAASEATLVKRIESAMERELKRVFPTQVRAVSELEQLLARDPFKAFRLPPTAKKVVTFLRAAPTAGIALPIEKSGARILKIDGREVFTAYERSEEGPVFMLLIERTFGKEVTTRTWDTIGKVVR